MFGRDAGAGGGGGPRQTGPGQPQTQPLSMKFILVGESGVGKSSLVHRATDRHFEERSIEITVGVETKQLLLPRVSDGDGDGDVKVSLWDAGGSDAFRDSM